jgi:hypothetical protein
MENGGSAIQRQMAADSRAASASQYDRFGSTHTAASVTTTARHNATIAPGANASRQS